MDTFTEYLNSQKCWCGASADHRQFDAKPPYKNGNVCNEHIDPNASVFALND